jgi:hypothetical protein
MGDLVSKHRVLPTQLVDDRCIGADDLFEAVAVLAEPVAFGLELV